MKILMIKFKKGIIWHGWYIVPTIKISQHIQNVYINFYFLKFSFEIELMTQ